MFVFSDDVLQNVVGRREDFFLFFLPERGRGCQKIGNNQWMGQDPRTGIKAENRGQWENTKEEYLWAPGNFEGLENESGENTY